MYVLSVMKLLFESILVVTQNFKIYFQIKFQISAATSAKQEQLRAIQQSMMAAAGTGGSGKNKNKPVSTVEPFQRQQHGGAVPKVEDLHNSINKNHHGQQPYLDDKDAKYQTLPFGSGVRYNNNGVQSKKDLQNVRFSEAPASSSDYQRSYIPTDHQGNYASNNDNNNIPKSGGLKPMNSVAPVVISSNQSRDSSPDDLLLGGKSKPALPPKPMTSQLDRNGSISPPPYVPAPPPGSSSTNIDTSPESVDTAITILRGGKRYVDGQHPSEEGTSVDDDMPSEEDDEHSGNGGSNGGGLTVMPNVHISINRRIEMPPAFHFPENQPPPSDLLSGHQVFKKFSFKQKYVKISTNQ